MIKKRLLSLFVLGFLAFNINLQAQTYHEDDKEGLRVFLRKPTTSADILNLHRVGLEIADTANWQADEVWVTKIEGIAWNGENPKRINVIYWEYKNMAGSLDAGKWMELDTLRCDYNQLGSLDISKNTKLRYLDCDSTQISTLDVSNNNALTLLVCHNNRLTDINISQNTELLYFSCYNNQIENIDVSNNTKLINFWCDENRLTELNVSKNLELEYFACGRNLLTVLDVRNNLELLFSIVKIIVLQA